MKNAKRVTSKESEVKNMVACAWHDTKRLTMVSNVDTNLSTDKEIRSEEHPSGH